MCPVSERSHNGSPDWYDARVPSRLKSFRGPSAGCLLELGAEEAARSVESRRETAKEQGLEESQEFPSNWSGQKYQSRTSYR